MTQPITPREQDFSRWYTDVIQAATLADYSPVKGCMVIRPYGYAIWERIREVLDRRIKETGHENAYFPLFIPKSLLAREAEHVEGFAKECAIVTHSRLKAVEGGVVPDPESKLEEELVVRPTSETIMYSMFAKWIASYRNLPLLINQWANVVRWEMRTRLFLRTTEFLWQEGHTAHETFEEAEAETHKMLGVYRELSEGTLAVPVIPGAKSDSEKFAGALKTYCIEAMMQDRKALQMGTSHNLGQNFAKAFDVKFQGRDGKLAHVWQTSWGVSTRLIGAVILMHSDDRGLVLPPRLAPIEGVIVPIWKDDSEKANVLRFAESVAASIVDHRVKIDDREQHKPGFKFFEWEKKGVPLRMEIGPRDVNEGKVVVVRRDTGAKTPVPAIELAHRFPALLEEIQEDLLRRAREFREAHMKDVDRYDDFRAFMEADSGFTRSHHCGGRECEAKIKDDTKATIRCLPLDGPRERGACIACGAPSERRAIFGKAY